MELTEKSEGTCQQLELLGRYALPITQQRRVAINSDRGESFQRLSLCDSMFGSERPLSGDEGIGQPVGLWGGGFNPKVS